MQANPRGNAKTLSRLDWKVTEKRPYVTTAISIQDERTEYNIRGGQHLNTLRYTLWYLLGTLRFCLKHHEMFVEDITMKKNEQGKANVT